MDSRPRRRAPHQSLKYKPEKFSPGGTLTNTDPIERAKAHAEVMYPAAAVQTRDVRGRPVVLALEDNLIRLIRFDDLDAPADSGV